MPMDYSLKLEVNQKLVMTPQLRQAIAILQLSTMELSAMIEKELLENPMLEIDDMPSKGDEGAEEAPASAETADSLTEYFDWVDYFNEGMQERRGPIDNSQEQQPYERLAGTTVSLQEHLELQLHVAVQDALTEQIGLYVIGCIDDNGYLRATLAEAAAHFGVSEQRVEEVLLMIQTFDPAGVGARSLQECLLLQWRQLDKPQALVEDIIERFLPEVAENRYRVIAEQLGCTPHQVQEAVDAIRLLDPKPGRAFGGGAASYIVPDITVERVNGKYVIIINDTGVPQLTINPYYRNVAREGDAESRSFIEGRINSAVWLIKSIEQRRRTLYNVMEAIIELQQPFFDEGPKHLRPLIMRQVAERIEMHESTVSRAIAGKYVNTPHGLFSLRSFFSSSLQGSGGEDVAAAKVKQKIRELIEQEDRRHPLSDQVLSEVLAKQGVQVSRRTVAKYREEMQIASSAKRKRY